MSEKDTFNMRFFKSKSQTEKNAPNLILSKWIVKSALFDFKIFLFNLKF